MQLQYNKTSYYVIILFVIAASFRTFSSMYFPALNSDDGINILMVHFFKIPDTLYFWGQDRYGSLIPLIAKPLYVFFNLKAETAESIVHFGILVAGFFAYASLLKNTYSKILFSFVYFFPPYHLIEFFRNNIGVSYALIGIILYVINKVKTFEFNLLKKYIAYAFIILLALSAIWVSELAFFSILLLLLFKFKLSVSKLKKISLTSYKEEIAFFLLGAILISYFIYYAKSNAIRIETFNGINNINELISSFIIFFQSIVNLILFKSKEPFTGVYLIFLLAIISCFIFEKKKIKINSQQTMFAQFLLLEIILITGIILLSNWSFLNNVPRRYFVGTYIFSWLIIIILFENTLFEKKRTKLYAAVLLATVFIGGIGTFYNLKYIWPKTLTPKMKIVSEFKQLGEIGIIADYWNSYITACANPPGIKATPHDALEIRNREMTNEVMDKKNIYVIRDGWLEKFPDTLKQFNRTLIKSGNPFIIGECNVCIYRNELLKNNFDN